MPAQTGAPRTPMTSAMMVAVVATWAVVIPQPATIARMLIMPGMNRLFSGRKRQGTILSITPTCLFADHVGQRRKSSAPYRRHQRLLVNDSVQQGFLILFLWIELDESSGVLPARLIRIHSCTKLMWYLSLVCNDRVLGWLRAQISNGLAHTSTLESSWTKD